LRDKVFFDKETVNDYETIEDLLEAFGRPRNLVLKRLREYGIYSYEEYIAELNKPPRKRLPVEVIANISSGTISYLNSMAQYFIKKENIKPEIWELKKT
jgi:hypothetical protein